MPSPIYQMNTVAHAVGTKKTEAIAEETLANIAAVRAQAEAYQAANAGQTSLAAFAHMNEIIEVCNREQERLRQIGLSLQQNNTIIVNTDSDGRDIFQGYVGT
ncbi:hypothetical protein [Tsukamurella strandjordii]|uniref:Uncharacterized protein n=1 Tax=Tsukamurella strandjordii TaxID=147577 RepID=A0AA90SFZ3_9ACTN|nr:hypothetical protein [Tsukamurella strandjordii]MDP0397134.1 hypothetical protein [Tsukamurella strandjordii]